MGTRLRRSATHLVTTHPFVADGRQTGRVTRRAAVDRALPWVLRAVWVGVLVAGGDAVDDASSAVRKAPLAPLALGDISIVPQFNPHQPA